MSSVKPKRRLIS
ncbi:hypothetical protein LINPERPRIM_LOCUS23200 [Linum perenne]